MAITATGKTAIEVSYSTTNDRDIAETKENKNTKTDSTTDYAAGTSTQQVNRVYSDRRSLTASSGTDDLNLSALTDPQYGVAINFVRISWIYVKNRVDSGGPSMLVGGAGAGAFSGPFNGNTSAQIELAPGDELFISNKLTGWDVPTAASILRITHDGGSSGGVDYDI